MTTSIDSAVGTAKEAFGTAKHAAKDASEQAAEAMMGTADDAAKTAKKLVSFLRHIELNDVLGLVGLRRRRSGFETVALIGGGVLLGAGVALLLAPLSGRDARQQILGFLDTLSGRAKGEIEDVKEKAGKLAGEVKEKAGEVAGDVKEKVGEVVGQAQGEGEGAQAEETGDERKGRRRHNQNAQVS